MFVYLAVCILLIICNVNMDTAFLVSMTAMSVWHCMSIICGQNKNKITFTITTLTCNVSHSFRFSPPDILRCGEKTKLFVT